MAIGSSFSFLSLFLHFFGFLFHRTFCMHRQIHHLLDLLKSRAHMNFFYRVSFLHSTVFASVAGAFLQFEMEERKLMEICRNFIHLVNYSRNYIFGVN
jgi:hypothetical protein